MKIIPNRDIKLVLNKITENVDIEDTINWIIEFYLLKDRHRYSEVAKYINEKSINDEQIISFILMNLEMIIDYCQGNPEILNEQIISIKDGTKHEDSKLDCNKLIEKLHKLNDHVELELDRIQFSVKREREVRVRMVDDLNNTLRNAQNDMISTANNIEAKLNNTVISVLGIFSAIIIAFFGGLNVLANILTYLPNSDISIYRLVFISCLTGIIVFNIVFMLLYFISRMLDKDMGGFCGFNIIIKYEESTELIPRLYYRLKIIMKRHPMMFWFNSLIVFIMTSTFIVWLISKLFNLIKN